MSHVMNTYARQPVAFVRGQGVWLWDEAGKKYLDALAGIAVNTLGHNHPRLVRALTEQIGRIIHSSNLFQMPLQEQAADRIAADHRPGRGVLLQFRAGSERGRDQGRAQVRPRPRHRRARHHRHGEGLPRPLAGDAVGHRQPQGAGRLRAAGAGLRARAAERPGGGAPGRRAQQERGGGVRRADPGRRRHQRLAPGVPEGPARKSATATNGCSCPTRCSAAWGAPASGSSTSTPASCPTWCRSPRASPAACRWAPAWSAAARRACSSPATTARPSAATRSRCAAW